MNQQTKNFTPFLKSLVGTVLALPISGLLAQHLGWEWIFYVFGVMGLVWCVGWIYVVKDNPEEDRNITDQELEYLRTGKSNFISKLYFLNYFVSSTHVNKTKNSQAYIVSTHLSKAMFSLFQARNCIVFIFNTGQTLSILWLNKIIMPNSFTISIFYHHVCKYVLAAHCHACSVK